MTDQSIDMVIYDFCDHLRRRKFSPLTLTDYSTTLRVFSAFLADIYPDVHEITDVTRHMVKGYEQYLTTKQDRLGKTLSRERRSRHLSHLKSLFRYLLREERVYSNPASGIELPRLKKTVIKDVLTVEEMDSLLKSCAGDDLRSLRDRAILELLYSSGIRSEELCHLRPEALDMEAQPLFVRQGKLCTERIVPFGSAAKYWVTRYMTQARPLMPCQDREYLFVSLKGRKMSHDTLCRIVRKRAGEAGIEKRITTHTFRHSCATHMLKGRADIRYVQRQLGHRGISTTEKYLKIEITDLKEVHERCHPREQEDWGEKK